MQHHVSSVTVGAVTGMASLSLPDGVTSWFGKLFLGVAIAIISGIAHGLAKRWASPSKKGDL